MLGSLFLKYVGFCSFINKKEPPPGNTFQYSVQLVPTPADGTPSAGATQVLMLWVDAGGLCACHVLAGLALPVARLFRPGVGFLCFLWAPPSGAAAA